MNTLAVIICVYNGDKDCHFKEALSSLLPGVNFISEVILVVNGEVSDFKKNTIDLFSKNLPIKPIFLESNLGLSRGLNIAIEQSSSDWLVRFDSDDICSKTRFNIISNAINQYGSQYDVIGTFQEEFSNSSDLRSLRRVPLTYQQIKKRLIFRNPMNHVTVFLKRSLFEKYKEPTFYPSIDYFEDYALWYKLLYGGAKFLNLSEITVFVRTGSEMLGRRGGLIYLLNEIKFRLFTLKYIRKSDIPLNFLITLFRLFAFLMPPFIKANIYKLIRRFA